MAKNQSDGGNLMEVLPPIHAPMSAPTDPDVLALSLPDATPFPEWLSIGRGLATQKRQIDWLIGDWFNFGRKQFPEQIDMAFDSLAIDPKAARLIEKTAKAFPPQFRDAALAFEHHAKVADMPLQEALPLLKSAREEKLTPGALGVRAMERKLETGQNLPREIDAEDDAMLALVRAWNRAPHSVRSDFSEYVAASHLGLIEFAPC